MWVASWANQSSASNVFVDVRFITKVGHSVKVQIDDVVII
jgi:hypothetical protein